MGAAKKKEPRVLSSREAAQAAANCACLSLRKTSRSVTQYFDAILSPTGLRSTQFSILLAICIHGPVSRSFLAQEMVMDRSTLTRNLRPLEKSRLIRTIADTDQRKRVVELTSAGHAKIFEIKPYWEKAQAQVVLCISKAGWKDLQETLNGLLREMQTAR